MSVLIRLDVVLASGRSAVRTRFADVHAIALAVVELAATPVADLRLADVMLLVHVLVAPLARLERLSARVTDTVVVVFERQRVRHKTMTHQATRIAELASTFGASAVISDVKQLQE